MPICLWTPGGGPTQFDSAGPGLTGSSVSSLQWTHTPAVNGGGPRSGVIVFCSYYSGPTPSAVNTPATYGGVTMTYLGYESFGVDYLVAWQLYGIPRTAQLVKVSFSSSPFSVGADSLIYDNISGFGQAVGNTGSGSMSLPATGPTRGMVCCGWGSSYPITWGAYGTERINWAGTSGNASLSMGDAPADGTSHTFLASNSGSTSWGAIAIPINH
jgi:hypothetical protein